MPETALDILFFGAHPDDVEISAGGLLFQLSQKGKAVGIIDLTQGEMGTYGALEDRRKEALAAAEILGVKVRETLDLGDARLGNNRENQLLVTEKIRKYRPKIVVCPTTFDKHPDHAAAGQLLTQAYFLTRLPKLKLSSPAHSPSLLMRYFMHDYTQASFIVDITDVFSTKMAAIAAYKSQMSERVVPAGFKPIGITNYQDDLTARARYYGSLIQTAYGEPYLLDYPPRLNDPFLLI